jgi:flagellar biosynthesis protein FlhG
LSPQTLLTALAADHLVLVTNPEIAALTDAYALIKCLARQPRMPDGHVVVNRVGEPGQGRLAFERLAEVTQRFAGRSLHFLGEVPENPEVSHRRLGQPPLLVSHDACDAAAAVVELMHNLELQAGTLRRRPRAHGAGVEHRLLRHLRD